VLLAQTGEQVTFIARGAHLQALRDLDAAAAQLSPLVGPHTMVLSLQNGIDSAERLTKIVAPAAVLCGAAYVAATRVAPGVVVHRGMNRIIFGEQNAGPAREQNSCATCSAGLR
jgi:2-dehydropantoate 2-reductase